MKKYETCEIVVVCVSQDIVTLSGILLPEESIGDGDVGGF